MTRKSSNAMKMFDEIEIQTPGNNWFDLTHARALTGRPGYLIPVMCKPILPTDKIKVNTQILVRFPALLAPMFQRVDVVCHTFFCPTRLVYPDWDEFISMQETGGIPQFTYDGTFTEAQERFLEYFGIPRYSLSPELIKTGENISGIPMAVYQKIYNDWYRPQRLVAEQAYELPSGPISAPSLNAIMQFRKKSWQHDYFTSCLPDPQFGDPVLLNNEIVLAADWSTIGNPRFVDSTGVAPFGGSTAVNQVNSAIAEEDRLIEVQGVPYQAAYQPAGTLQMQTSVNQLREAYAQQRFLEKIGRAGQRYPEFLKAVFGATPLDARLQQPEYITGMKAPVIISEVLNTTGIDGELPQGHQAGHAISIGDGYEEYYEADEFGWIMTIMSVVPSAQYVQGIPREFTKTEPHEFGIPDFANIGEQEVLVRELYAFSNGSADTFGYIPRYSDYKHADSDVRGDYLTTLKQYHCSRIFGNDPALNASFMEIPDNIFDNVFAVTDEDVDNIWFQVLNQLEIQRPLPYYSTPL